MSTSTEKAIEDQIKSHKVFLFVKTYCPHCKGAREALKAAGVDFKVEEIDLRPEHDMKEIQNILEKITGARSVPRIFINGTCIGGESDLKEKYVQTGRITELCH